MMTELASSRPYGAYLKTVRWFLVLPAAVLSWYLCVFLGIVFVSSLDYVCPDNLMVSSRCIVNWHAPVVDVLLVVFVSLSAFVVVLTSAFIAPEKKGLVAKVVFSAGVLVAAYFTYYTSEWTAFIGAIVFGLLAVRYCQVVYSGPSVASKKR